MKYLILCPPSKASRNVIRDFVYGCWCKGRRIGGARMPPTNLLSIATVLRKDGRDVEMVDAAVESAPRSFVLHGRNDPAMDILLEPGRCY